MPRLPAVAIALLAMVTTGVVAACGAASAPQSPVPTPLPTGVLRHRYLAAAEAYTQATTQVAAAEAENCDPSAQAADLTKCAAALSADRQATVTFDDAIRRLRFPENAAGAVTQLLSDDAHLEALLQQASTGPSLSAVAALTPQIFELLSAAARDADAVRRSIGLPQATPSPAAPPAA